MRKRPCTLQRRSDVSAFYLDRSPVSNQQPTISPVLVAARRPGCVNPSWVPKREFVLVCRVFPNCDEFARTFLRKHVIETRTTMANGVATVCVRFTTLIVAETSTSLFPIVDDLLSEAAQPLLVPAFDKDVVGNSVPGLRNTDEEQQQRRRSNGKHGVVCMGTSRVCRCSQRCVRREGQRNMKQPIFELGLVCGLHPHTPDHDDLVHDPTETQ